MPRKRSAHGVVPVMILLEPEQYKALKDASHASRVPMSALVREALKQHLAPQPEEQPTVPEVEVTEDERVVLEQLRQPAITDELAGSMPIPRLLNALLMLEMKGLIRRSGSRYERR